MSIGWHIIMRKADDRVIAPSTADRRRLSRSLARVTPPFTVLAFNFPGTHGHVLMVGDRYQAGELARRIEIGLHQVLRHDIRWERARFIHVETQRHLEHALPYVLDQARHHGMDPVDLLDAGNLPDLLGLRLMATATLRAVRNHCPQVRRADLTSLLGTEPRSLPRPTSLALLRPAALAAACIPGDTARGDAIRDALAAAAQIGAAQARAMDVARSLALPLSTTRRLRHSDAAPRLIEAVDAQWRLLDHSASRSAFDAARSGNDAVSKKRKEPQRLLR